MRTVGASAVRFFLARAVSPRVQANARWIAINAKRRRAFSVSGKEPGSPLLGFIASGRAELNHSFETAAATLGVDEQVSQSGYLYWYRILNHGYPFLDYSKSETLVADAELMAAYAAGADAPPLATNRHGFRYRLSPGSLERHHEQAQTASESLVAGWLQVVGGITHVLPLSHSQAAFRTSPSGGARHPTDIGLYLGDGWAGELQGSWWYDPLDHELIRSDSRSYEIEELDGPIAVFTISSHVRRAMWRYRDARAYRPIVIDAGHIIETLLTVISYTGWHASWVPAPGLIEADDDFDPIFGYVIATRTYRVPHLRHNALPKPEPRTTAIESSDSYRTNPLISLVPTAEGIVGENHLTGTNLALSAGMIDALAYATPSSRRDRPTTASHLTGLNLDSQELQQLVQGGLLLSEAWGDEIWSRSQAWSDHDWFVSLLAHVCECSSASPSPSSISVRVPRATGPNLAEALDRRRTGRSLIPGPIPLKKAVALIDCITPPKGLKVIVSARHSVGPLEPGIFAVGDRGFTKLSLETPSDADVIKAAIGQPWAGAFRCILWLIPEPTLEPGTWIAGFIESGRLAQRVCLETCDDSRIGIFQSPALIDDRLLDILGAEVGLDGAYIVGIGILSSVGAEAARLSNANIRFVPSTVFTATRRE
jgi:hypothetical protein